VCSPYMMFRTNPGTWKLGVFWKRTHAKTPKIGQNRRNRRNSSRTDPISSGIDKVRIWLGTLFKECTRISQHTRVDNACG